MTWLAPLFFALVQGPSVPCAEELGRFRGLLGELRAGDEEVLAPLRASAAKLCAECARCDAGEVAEFYAALEPEARAQGRVEEARYLELREEVLAAGSTGADWELVRPRILGELRTLAERVRLHPDFVPAAQASSLCARIEVERVENDPRLSTDERAQLAELAEADAREASRAFERAGQVTPRLEPEWLLGRLACWRGLRGAARASFERCLSEAERVGNLEFREHALQGLLTLARGAGNVPEERRRIAEIASFRDPRENWPLAREWSARLLQDDHAEAAADFLERNAPGPASHIADRIDWELLTGSALLRLGELDDARPHFERLAGEGASELAVLSLARLAIEQGRPFEALDLLERPELALQLSPRGGDEALQLAGEARIESGDLERGAAQLDEYLARADRRDDELALEPLRGADPAELRAADAAARSVIGEWAGLHAVALLADARSRLGDPLEAVRVIEDAQVRALRRENDARLQLGAGDESLQRQPLTRGDVTSWANAFELGIVTWVVGPDFSVVGHVAPGSGGAWTARIERGRESIREAARRLRETALSSNAARIDVEAAQIRATLLPDALVARLRALLEQADARGSAVATPRLLFLLHGPLESLPIELIELFDAATDARVAVLALPGLPEPSPGAPLERAALARWQLLGDPLGGNARAVLPGARAELASIAEIHPGSIASAGARFDRDALRAALSGSDPVHIATHLLARTTGGDAGWGELALLLSAGETLGADEVAALAPRLPLVVLSACESGGGRWIDAEGLQGLARAFLQSGTRDVLVTSWPVEDGAAARFALEFHRALAAGESPARATLLARQALRQAGAAPADWAAFRLLGRD